MMAQTNEPHGTTEVAARGWPISLIVAIVVVVSMLAVATAILTVGWFAARSSLVIAATRTATDSGALVNERARRMLEPVQASLRQISFDVLVSATTLDERLARLFVLSEELTANPLLSSLYVGYKNGEFILVRALDKPEHRKLVQAPAGANFMAQARTLRPGGKIVGEYFFYTANAVLIERRTVPTYQFDPRTRPWFISADATSAAVMSDPYFFFTTRQVGLSLSQLSRDGNAVVGIDVVLDELSQALGDLRVTPGAHLALVNNEHQVLAYPDMDRAMEEEAGRFKFKTVQQLGVPALKMLDSLNAKPGEAQFFDAEGRTTLGMVLPFDVWEDKQLKLLVTVPEDELMGEMLSKGRQLTVFVLVIVLLMLPLGWMAGRRIGRNLNSLARRAARLGRFDFSGSPLPATAVREVSALNDVITDMSHTIKSFLKLSQHIATEPQVEKMLDQVLRQLVQATRSDAACVYLWEPVTGCMRRTAAEGFVDSDFLSEFVYPQSYTPGAALPVLPAGLAIAEIELRGRTGDLQGLLVQVHAADIKHSDHSFQDFSNQLSGMLAVSIETRQLIEAQKALLDAVIRLMADAIDAKSAYTGGHCERVPALATMLVDRMCAEAQGPYAAFKLSEDQRYEFHLGAWLHDCGKVTSAEHIVDKATKLELIYNRIHEIRMRFEVLLRDAQLEYLARLQAGEDQATSGQTLAARQAQLQDDFAFVAHCNAGGEFMADDAIARLRAIGKQTWLRHFDDTLGLSFDEIRRAKRVQGDANLPAQEALLADRPDHIVPWGERKPAVEAGNPDNKYGFDMTLPQHQQNMGELHNLTVRRGTLTDEDRFKINDHIVQTYIMLKSLPWPKHLAGVPEIAATHHEKMDGKGYPRKLPAERLTSLDRVMAIADIFEALTASDRPYKAAKTLTESLRIMAFMCKDQHIDPDLFRYFLHSGLWLTFAQSYMNPAQIDAVDVAAIEKILPQAAL